MHADEENTKVSFDLVGEDLDVILSRLTELEAFRDEWAPYLVQLNQALVSVLNMAMPMLPPGMVPLQVKSFMRRALGE